MWASTVDVITSKDDGGTGTDDTGTGKNESKKDTGTDTGTGTASGRHKRSTVRPLRPLPPLLTHSHC